LQKHCQLFVHRVWAARVRQDLRRKMAATAIQRRYRGTLDRQLCRMMAYKRWYITKFIPSILLVQSVVRRYHAIKLVNLIRRRDAAVRTIQHAFAEFCARRLARAVVKDLRKLREFRAASNIQRYVRRRLAIVAFRRKKLEYKGRIIQAAKVITRAWASYQLAKRYRVLLEQHRRKYLGAKIYKYVVNRREVHEEMKEIRADIALCHKAIERRRERIRLIEVFQAQAAIRSNNVKKEMSQLRVEDFERGRWWSCGVVVVVCCCSVAFLLLLCCAPGVLEQQYICF
jgi:hypothetical protein